MASTLQQAIASIKRLDKSGKTLKGSISDELLGKYKGIIPIEKNSSVTIRELRASLYGKVKD